MSVAARVTTVNSQWSTASPVWKMAGLPGSFAETLPEQFADFARAMPVSSYTHGQGVFNLRTYPPAECAYTTVGMLLMFWVCLPVASSTPQVHSTHISH